MVKLNLGCGRRNLDGKDWVNVDKYPHPNVDALCDLDAFPYPFKDNSADYIYLNHVLEHLKNPYDVILECHRILKTSGILEIKVPHKNHLSAYDVAHKSLFTERSMCHLVDNGKDTSDRIHNESEKSGSSLQCNSYFEEIYRHVKRVIPTPWGYLPGFNIYKNAVGIGIRCEIHWKLKKE